MGCVSIHDDDNFDCAPILNDWFAKVERCEVRAGVDFECDGWRIASIVDLGHTVGLRVMGGGKSEGRPYQHYNEGSTAPNGPAARIYWGGDATGGVPADSMFYFDGSGLVWDGVNLIGRMHGTANPDEWAEYNTDRGHRAFVVEKRQGDLGTGKSVWKNCTFNHFDYAFEFSPDEEPDAVAISSGGTRHVVVTHKSDGELSLGTTDTFDSPSVADWHAAGVVPGAKLVILTGDNAGTYTIVENGPSGEVDPDELELAENFFSCQVLIWFNWFWCTDPRCKCELC